MSTAETTVEPAVLRCGWLRHARFDLTLIGGVALLALVSGLVVLINPDLFVIVLVLDLWCLGYPHVISTFTRLSDPNCSPHLTFLVYGLPWIVLAATLLVSMTVGLWVIATTYLYWQWFHYTRQSYGLLRMFSRKSGADAKSFASRQTVWTIYLLPLWGILYRSYQNPDTFLGAEVVCLNVPLFVLYGVGAAAVGMTLWWTLSQIRAFYEGTASLALFLYVVSHLVVFSVSYLAIDNIDHGWLVVNVWHNAQYIMIVWLYNTRRFKDGPQAEYPTLSKLCQPNRLFWYAAACFFVSTALYGLVGFVTRQNFSVALTAVVIYQTINFHHYVVDGIIWKVRKKALQKTMGLTSSG